jgi:hypothetical protein
MQTSQRAYKITLPVAGPTFWQYWLGLFTQFSATYKMEKRMPEDVAIVDKKKATLKEETLKDSTLLNLRAWSSVRGIPGAGAKDTTLQVFLAALMSSVGENHQRASQLVSVF